MAQKITLIKVFISSPGDLEAERKKLRNFINEYKAVYETRFEAVIYEKDIPLICGMNIQEYINTYLSDCDICVVMFRDRFGTPTDNYNSGTEEELCKALSDDKEVITYFFPTNDALSLSSYSQEEIKQLFSLKEFKKDLCNRKIFYASVDSYDEMLQRFINLDFNDAIKRAKRKAFNKEEIERELKHSGINDSKLINDVVLCITGDLDTRITIQKRFKCADKDLRNEFLKCMGTLLDFSSETVRGEAYFCLGELGKNLCIQLPNSSSITVDESFLVEKGLSDKSDFVKACCANVLRNFVPLSEKTTKILTSELNRLEGLHSLTTFSEKLKHYAELTLNRNIDAISI